MNSIRRFFNKLALLFQRDRFAAELDEEMAFHRGQAVRELIAAGVTPEAARYAAMRQFGSATRLKQRGHEVVGFKLETVVQDLRFALLQLRRNPGFALTAIVILALGMGASVAIFAFVDAALIKPLPYPDPTRLVAINESTHCFRATICPTPTTRTGSGSTRFSVPWTCTRVAALSSIHQREPSPCMGCA